MHQHHESFWHHQGRHFSVNLEAEAEKSNNNITKREVYNLKNELHLVKDKSYHHQLTMHQFAIVSLLASSLLLLFLL
ncbi:MAG: hypothetical protein OHK0017_04540 [Patescibacteria group bacterium]